MINLDMIVKQHSISQLLKIKNPSIKPQERYNILKEIIMTEQYLNKLYEAKLVTREMTRDWLNRFNAIFCKLCKKCK